MIRTLSSVFFGVLLILAICMVPTELSARPKKPLGEKCSCTCESDEKVCTQSGGCTIPRYRSEVSFVDTDFSCYGNNGGGCRVKNVSGSYQPGTLRDCTGNGIAYGRFVVINPSGQRPSVQIEEPPYNPKRPGRPIKPAPIKPQ